MGHFITNKLGEIRIMFSTKTLKWTMKNRKKTGYKYLKTPRNLQTNDQTKRDLCNGRNLGQNWYAVQFWIIYDNLREDWRREAKQKVK